MQKHLVYNDSRLERAFCEHTAACSVWGELSLVGIQVSRQVFSMPMPSPAAMPAPGQDIGHTPPYPVAA